MSIINVYTYTVCPHLTNFLPSGVKKNTKTIRSFNGTHNTHTHDRLRAISQAFLEYLIPELDRGLWLLAEGEVGVSSGRSVLVCGGEHGVVEAGKLVRNKRTLALH